MSAEAKDSLGEETHGAGNLTVETYLLKTTEVDEGERIRATLYARFLKRGLDFALALTSLALTAPLFLIFTVLIRFDSKGPVFFRQWRVGRGGRQFQIIKFRTMLEGAEQAGSKITAANDPRITSFGRWLRRTKLDELPQLMNVLRGNMSLVGPRPELPSYVANYSQGQRRILRVRPGMTSPASLTFINEEEILARHSDGKEYYSRELIARKLELDLAYCDRVSLQEDTRLIWKTLAKLCSAGERKAGSKR